MTLQELKDKIYVQEFSEEEIDEMMDRHLELVQAGKIEEANALGAKIPKGSMMLTHLKERFGLQYLIEEQYNLINPIKEYGYEWLESK